MLNIIEIVSELNKNTNSIKEKYEELQKELEEKNNKIKDLESKIIDQQKIIDEQNNIINFKTNCNDSDCNEEDENLGLLGDINKLSWISENGAVYSINNGNLIIEGKNRYANIYLYYKEVDGNYVEGVRTKYILNVEGNIERGCTNGYICSRNYRIINSFNKEIELFATWKRTLKVTFMLNQANWEDSKVVISKIKLSLG